MPKMMTQPQPGPPFRPSRIRRLKEGPVLATRKILSKNPLAVFPPVCNLGTKFLNFFLVGFLASLGIVACRFASGFRVVVFDGVVIAFFRRWIFSIVLLRFSIFAFADADIAII